MQHCAFAQWPNCLVKPPPTSSACWYPPHFVLRFGLPRALGTHARHVNSLAGLLMKFTPVKCDDLEIPHALPVKHQARLLMEAVGVLHQRGYGRLKLYCYVKGGLGAWRHWIFASDVFPDSIAAWPGKKSGGSLPGMALFTGVTIDEVAENILSRHPALSESARGRDAVYVDWYKKMLSDYPDGILEMESPYQASIIDCGDIKLPALKAWTRPPPTPISPEQLAAAREVERQKEMELARQRHLRRRKHKHKLNEFPGAL